MYSFASTPLSTPFNFAEPGAIEAEMQELSEMEKLVAENGWTKETLPPNAQCLLTQGDWSASIADCVAPEHELLLGIPGFFWGFCCCIFGMFMVYINIDDPVSRKEEGTQAIIGCSISALLWALLYVWVWVSAN